MASNKGKLPASSGSSVQAQSKVDSKDAKASDGGVKLPNGMQKVDEKDLQGAIRTNGGGPAGSVIVPVTAMAGQSSTDEIVKQADTAMPVVNGNSTNGKVHQAQANHSAKLSVNATTFKPKPAPISFLNHDSIADDSKSDDTGPVIVSSVVTPKTNQTNGKCKTTQEPIGTRGENISPIRRVFFTTDVGPNVTFLGGHYIMIMNVHQRHLAHLLKGLYERYDYETKLIGYACPPKLDAQSFGGQYHDVFCAFDDVRAAAASFHEIHVVDTKVNIKYISHNEYAAARLTGHASGKHSAFCDGQVIFFAHFVGLTTELTTVTTQHLSAEVYALAESFGEVLAFIEIECGGGAWQFRAEYYKISVAKEVAETITKAKPKQSGKWTIYAEELPDCSNHVGRLEPIYKLENDATCMSMPQKTGFIPGEINTSPTGRTAWRTGENGERIPVAAPKQLPKTITNAAPWGAQHPRNQSDPFPQTPLNGFMAIDSRTYWNSWSGPSGHSYRHEESGYSTAPSEGMYGTPTSVDADKILSGQDVRTTVMLRNLPNTMKFQQLKHLLDAVSFGKYDFSYLRVDFTNNQNVGYGFVNFTDPMYIVDFIRQYVGRPWIQGQVTHRKRGPRIADVSYATVQGYDCLVEKFRNSSIMDEYPEYRPKLWWTFESATNPADVGTEISFPRPNNASKHQRSKDNATHIGLYTSGKGHNRNRHGSRNRRSQYDRGTSAQMREDANYNQQFLHMSPLQGGYGYVGSNYMIGGPPMPVGPPPRFPIMPASGVNGFMMPNGAGPMSPYGYGPIHFTDPFVNSGYSGVNHASSIAEMNGRLFGHPETPTSGRRFYQSGVDCDRIPKAIAEEDGFADEDTSCPNGLNGNAYGRAFGSQY